MNLILTRATHLAICAQNEAHYAKQLGDRDGLIANLRACLTDVRERTGKEIADLKKEAQDRAATCAEQQATLTAQAKQLATLRSDEAMLTTRLYAYSLQAKALHAVEDHPTPDPKVNAALTLAHDENALWCAIQTLIAAQERQETELALRPSLASEDRQYWTGRAAALLELRAALIARRAAAMAEQSEAA